MKPLNWGLIGCGDIAQRRIAPAMRNIDFCSLQAVSRSNATLLDAFADEFNVISRFADWKDLVRDPIIEAVYIATPVNLHAEMACFAARHGKHVLCEKPMGMNLSECQQMIRACKGNKVQLGVAYYRHFYPVIHEVKRIIAEGTIGDVMLVQVNAFSQFDRQLGEPRAWLLDPVQSGGGPMMDFGCHRIEVLLDLFGPIRNVKAHVTSLRYRRQVEDTAIAEMVFESGIVASLTVTHTVAEPLDTIDIYGTLGSLHIPQLNAGDLRIDIENKSIVRPLPPHPNLHQPLIEDFTRSVLNRKRPVVDGEIGLAVNEVLDKIYLSGKNESSFTF